MLNDKAVERLIKTVVKAIALNDSSVLEVSHVRWILNNWDLKPRMDFLPYGLLWEDRRIPKKQLAEFFASFDCFEHFVGDVDLRHVLGIINHYVKKDGYTENNLQWIARFRQRCYVVNEVRRRIKLYQYQIHCQYATYSFKWKHEGWKFKRYVMPYYGRNVQEALKRFRTEHRDDNHPHFTGYRWFVKRIREIKSTPVFLLYAYEMDGRLFQLLQ